MAYDEQLGDRVREVLSERPGLSERKMFGGLCFMLGGNMCCGIIKDGLMLRLGEEAADRALDRPHVRPMDFTGRPMASMVIVEPAGLRGAALRRWVDQAAEPAAALPAKVPKERRPRPRKA